MSPGELLTSGGDASLAWPKEGRGRSRLSAGTAVEARGECLPDIRRCFACYVMLPLLHAEAHGLDVDVIGCWCLLMCYTMSPYGGVN